MLQLRIWRLKGVPSEHIPTGTFKDSATGKRIEYAAKDLAKKLEELMGQLERGEVKLKPIQDMNATLTFRGEAPVGRLGHLLTKEREAIRKDQEAARLEAMQLLEESRNKQKSKRTRRGRKVGNRRRAKQDSESDEYGSDSESEESEESDLEEESEESESEQESEKEEGSEEEEEGLEKEEEEEHSDHDQLIFPTWMDALPNGAVQQPAPKSLTKKPMLGKHFLLRGFHGWFCGRIKRYHRRGRFTVTYPVQNKRPLEMYQEFILADYGLDLPTTSSSSASEDEYPAGTWLLFKK
jgi:hypothetical protein